MRFVASAALTVAACLVAWVGTEIAARAVLGPPAVHYGGTRAGCPRPAPGAPVVAVIGDSFAFGQGVAQGDDFSARLACDSGLDVRSGFFDSLARPDPARLAALGKAVAGFVADARRTAPQAQVLVAMAPEAATLSAGHRDFYASLAPLTLPDADRPSAIYEAARAACADAPGCTVIDHSQPRADAR